MDDAGLEKRIVRIPESGCWIWVGADRGKYGRIKNQIAHRVFYEKYKGKIPDNLFILHKCDVTFCVNPNHLLIGNARDNSHDMVNKCRMWRQKVRVNDRIAILNEYNSVINQRLIAEKYGITSSGISQIIRIMRKNGYATRTNINRLRSPSEGQDYVCKM